LQVRGFDTKLAERRRQDGAGDAFFHEPIEVPERMRDPPERKWTKCAGAQR
jgi:hypothetical protein